MLLMLTPTTGGIAARLLTDVHAADVVPLALLLLLIHSHTAAALADHCFADNYGPRAGIAFCLGLTAPAVFGIALVTNGTTFIISRLIIGFTLSNFVACQFWCTSTFNAKVVATANSFGAGMVSNTGMNIPTIMEQGSDSSFFLLVAVCALLLALRP